MQQINFKIDEFIGFYSLFELGFRLKKERHDTLLENFEDSFDGMRNLRDKLLSVSSEVPAFQKAQDEKEKKSILFNNLKELSKQVCCGKISSVDGVINFIDSRLGVKVDGLRNDYESYCSFIQKNHECLETNLKTMKHIYDDKQISSPNLSTDEIMPKTTGAYLDAMRNFFEVPSDKMLPTVHLHPFPEDPHLSGWATSNGIHQTLCVKRLESDDKYIDNTTMLARRVGTPLHESAHWMFENSPIMESFKKETKNPSPAVQHFISVMDRYLKENPEKDYYAPSPVSVMHEALASSAGIVLRPDSMKNFDYTKDELYYGFKAANDLARVVYPIFHEYIASGKKISDGFFERVISDDNFKKQFCLSDQNNVTKKTSTLQKTLADHVISTPKVQKGAILLDTNKIGMLRKHQSDR